MPSIHEQIRTAIRHLDTEGARRLVNEALKTLVDAELYYLASLVANNAAQRRSYLEKSLELDPHYIEASSELSKMARKPIDHSHTQRQRTEPKNNSLGTIRQKAEKTLFVLGLLLAIGFIAFNLLEKQNAERLPEDLAGNWVGYSYATGLETVYHELSFHEENGQIVGTASGETESGRADTYVRGSYADYHLILETYGGTVSGWTSVCHVRMNLEYREINGSTSLVGRFEGIPNENSSCEAVGTLEFERP